MDDVRAEIKDGGALTDSPCPFCKLPRCQRTDYIRCSRCGVNWLTGEDLSKDPRIDRFDKVVAEMKKPEKPKEAR